MRDTRAARAGDRESGWCLRVGLGFSYGGYLTAYAITQTNRFKPP